MLKFKNISIFPRLYKYFKIFDIFQRFFYEIKLELCNNIKKLPFYPIISIVHLKKLNIKK